MFAGGCRQKYEIQSWNRTVGTRRRKKRKDFIGGKGDAQIVGYRKERVGKRRRAGASDSW